MIKAILVPPDVEDPLVLVAVDERDHDNKHARLQNPIHRIDFWNPKASCYLVEPGSAGSLPENQRATVLAWAHNSMVRGGASVRGPVIITGPVDDQGYDSDVPDILTHILTEEGEFSLDVQVYGDDRWHTHEKRFPDWFDAYCYGVDLAQRWTQVSEIRIVHNAK